MQQQQQQASIPKIMPEISEVRTDLSPKKPYKMSKITDFVGWFGQLFKWTERNEMFFKAEFFQDFIFLLLKVEWRGKLY